MKKEKKSSPKDDEKTISLDEWKHQYPYIPHFPQIPPYDRPYYAPQQPMPHYQFAGTTDQFTFETKFDYKELKKELKGYVKKRIKKEMDDYKKKDSGSIEAIGCVYDNDEED